MAYTPEQRLTARDTAKKLASQLHQLNESLSKDLTSIEYLWKAIDKGKDLDETVQIAMLQDTAWTLRMTEKQLCRI